MRRRQSQSGRHRIRGNAALLDGWERVEGVVGMLLEQEDVNHDHVDTEYGPTPLSWAARNGHMGVVKMLFER